MDTISGENELLLTCAQTPEGIAILRCQTRDDTVRLPDEIGGRPVVSLGDYVLAERAPDLKGHNTFAMRVTCGGDTPVHDANAVRRVVLPAHCRSLGSYAFYNCRRLERLEVGVALTDVGGGALMNCRALRTFVLHAAPDAPTALPKLLGETATEVDVRLTTARPRACSFPPIQRSWRIFRPRTSSSAASTARATCTANALRAARCNLPSMTRRSPRCSSGMTLPLPRGSPCGGWRCHMRWATQRVRTI